jgi:hypothetical protein
MWSSWWGRAAVLLCCLAAALVGLSQRADAVPPRQHKPVPVNSRFEAATGIRITRIAVVGDGGLVDVRFIVLDPQKAHSFIGDSDHTTNGRSKLPPPTMRNAKRQALLAQVASMHAHTEFRAGQTYFLIYLNPSGKIHVGDTLDITGGKAKDTYVGIDVE